LFNADSIFNLVICYYFGDDVIIDQKKAYKLQKLAADIFYEKAFLVDKFISIQLLNKTGRDTLDHKSL
jgi:TPR repeat protein